MATETRRPFTPGFNREAVAPSESSGRSRVQVAAGLDIQPSTLRNRRLGSKARQPGTATPIVAGPPSPVSSPADQGAEVTRLKRGLDRARMEGASTAPLGRVDLSGSWTSPAPSTAARRMCCLPPPAWAARPARRPRLRWRVPGWPEAPAARSGVPTSRASWLKA